MERPPRGIRSEYVNRAIAYILGHLNEEISIDDVARHVGFSKFYFSRLFKETTGESLYEFIKRVRMDQSAFRLKVEKGRRISDVGAEYGYSASNYATAFRQHHKMSPAQFRRSILSRSLVHPTFPGARPVLESLEMCRSKITVETFDDLFVLFERYIGNYQALSDNWCAFHEKYGQYYKEGALIIERTFDDPSITDADACLYELCITVPRDCPLENTYTIPGGKFAVYHFQGRVEEIYFAYQSIFNVWLPQSGRQLDERYSFEIYREVGPQEMRIDLCIPIR